MKTVKKSIALSAFFFLAALSSSALPNGVYIECEGGGVCQMWDLAGNLVESCASTNVGPVKCRKVICHSNSLVSVATEDEWNSPAYTNATYGTDAGRFDWNRFLRQLDAYLNR